LTRQAFSSRQRFPKSPSNALQLGRPRLEPSRAKRFLPTLNGRRPRPAQRGGTVYLRPGRQVIASPPAAHFYGLRDLSLRAVTRVVTSFPRCLFAPAGAESSPNLAQSGGPGMFAFAPQLGAEDSLKVISCGIGPCLHPQFHAEKNIVREQALTRNSCDCPPIIWPFAPSTEILRRAAWRQ